MAIAPPRKRKSRRAETEIAVIGGVHLRKLFPLSPALQGLPAQLGSIDYRNSHARSPQTEHGSAGAATGSGSGHLLWAPGIVAWRRAIKMRSIRWLEVDMKIRGTRKAVLGSLLAVALSGGLAMADEGSGGWSPLPAIGHGGVASGGPDCGVVSRVDPVGSIWLGHFTGGNVGPLGPIPGGVDWRDQYACFSSRRSCEAWQRDMRSAFHGLQGYRTCLIIR